MYKKLFPLLLVVGCAYNTDVVFEPSSDQDAGPDIVDGSFGCDQPLKDSGSNDAHFEDVVSSSSSDAASLDSGCEDGGDGGAADSSDELDASADAIADAQPDVVVPVEPVDPPKPYVEYDVNHILSTGQSNSVANGSSPYLTRTQPYNNIMFNSGVMTAKPCDGQVCRGYDTPNSFVPLVEGDSFFEYPVETMSSAMANQITNLLPGHVSLVSLHGRSGNVYNCLRQYGCGWFPATNVTPFEEGMWQVRDGLRLATAQNKSYIVRAVTSVHGESDAYNNIFPQPALNNACLPTAMVNSYKDALVEWQCTYDKEIRKITNQVDEVPLLISQLSGQNKFAYAQVQQDQYLAHRDSNGKVVLVTPTYFLSYRNDCLHFSNVGTQMLGEYFAKAYNTIVVEGKKYEPLRPQRVYFKSVQQIAIDYMVPSPPLVIDSVTVSDPGYLGFEVYQNGVKQTLTGVDAQGSRVILFTQDVLIGPGVEVRYAMNQNVASCIGPFAGARGNIRDSDPMVSQLGNHLYNWSVQFTEQVQQ